MCQQREKKCKSLWGLDDFDAMDLNSSSEEEDVAEYAIFSTVSKTQSMNHCERTKHGLHCFRTRKLWALNGYLK